MPSVYILYSVSTDNYYTGFTTESVDVRIERHNSEYYDNKYTSIGRPWTLFLQIECATQDEARKIEAHIKKMKSRIYIENLKRYPEMMDKLKHKYNS